MKFNLIFTTALAASFLASCARVSDKTEIVGNVVPDDIEIVNIIVGDQIDTMIPVKDGKFAMTLPTNLHTLASVSAGHSIINFIPDGTKLKVLFDDVTTVKSSSPKISVQERFNAYNQNEESLGNQLTAKRQEIYSDSTLSDEDKSEKFREYYETLMVEYTESNKKVMEENKDNILSVIALDNLRYDMEDEQIAEAISSLSAELQEHNYVKAMKGAVQARINTAEGKKFTDFTVETVTAMTRSIPPKPLYKTVKFSDYVGKGKYVLVDFWSPWCGPCRREMPNIKAIYDKYKGKDFDVLSIAVWEREGAEVTMNAVSELGMVWNQINNAGSIPTEIYGIEGIPHIMLIGPDGTILHRGLYGAAIEEAVAKYLD